MKIGIIIFVLSIIIMMYDIFGAFLNNNQFEAHKRMFRGLFLGFSGGLIGGLLMI